MSFYALDILLFNLFHAEIGKLFALGFPLLLLSYKKSRYFENLSFTFKKIWLQMTIRQHIPFLTNSILIAINPFFIHIRNSVLILILNLLLININNTTPILKVITHSQNRQLINIKLIFPNFPDISLFLNFNLKVHNQFVCLLYLVVFLLYCLMWLFIRGFCALMR